MSDSNSFYYYNFSRSLKITAVCKNNDEENYENLGEEDD